MRLDRGRERARGRHRAPPTARAAASRDLAVAAAMRIGQGRARSS